MVWTLLILLICISSVVMWHKQFASWNCQTSSARFYFISNKTESWITGNRKCFIIMKILVQCLCIIFCIFGNLHCMNCRIFRAMYFVMCWLLLSNQYIGILRHMPTTTYLGRCRAVLRKNDWSNILLGQMPGVMNWSDN